MTTPNTQYVDVNLLLCEPCEEGEDTSILLDFYPSDGNFTDMRDYSWAVQMGYPIW